VLSLGVFDSGLSLSFCYSTLVELLHSYLSFDSNIQNYLVHSVGSIRYLF